MPKTATKQLAIRKIQDIQRVCRRTLKLEDDIKAATDHAATLSSDISTAVSRLLDVYKYLQGTGPVLVVPVNPLADIDKLTSLLTERLTELQELRESVVKWQKAAKDMLDDEEVQKQSWNTLETDWPFADAPNNLVNEAGQLVLDQDASKVSSFSGQDINQAVSRLTDIYSYLKGTAGGTVSPISMPGNPNRDIRELTIDNDVNGDS